MVSQFESLRNLVLQFLLFVQCRNGKFNRQQVVPAAGTVPSFWKVVDVKPA
jgi:hypothetical protein